MPKAKVYDYCMICDSQPCVCNAEKKAAPPKKKPAVTKKDPAAPVSFPQGVDKPVDNPPVRVSKPMQPSVLASRKPLETSTVNTPSSTGKLHAKANPKPKPPELGEFSRALKTLNFFGMLSSVDQRRFSKELDVTPHGKLSDTGQT